MPLSSNTSNKLPLPYQISYEPTTDLSPKKENLFYTLREQAIKGKRGIIEKLIKSIAKYPNEPSLKNYLLLVYKGKGKIAEAEKVAAKMSTQHPDYLFGKLALAELYIEQGEYEKVPEILGEQLELQLLYPGTEVFHISEVTSFYSVVMMYFIGLKEWRKAEDRLDLIREVEPEYQNIETLERTLHTKIMASTLASMAEVKAQTISVESFPVKIYPSSDKAPVLQHEILRIFYQKETNNFPTEVMEQILELLRETLIQDLEVILKDCIIRYDWFRKNYSPFNFAEQEFSVHALYFLGALKAKESLPLVLDLLKQGEDFLTYWYSDALERILLEPLYMIGESQLEELKAFVLTPNVYFSARLLASKVVAQIVFHQPERKEEAVAWFREVLQYHLDHPDNTGIIDTDFLNWTVDKVIKINAVSLEGIIKQLWDRGWILKGILGDFEEILEDLNEPIQSYHKIPMPRGIAEFYSGENWSRKEEKVYTEEEQAEMEKMLSRTTNNPLFKMLAKSLDIDNGTPQQVEPPIFDQYTANAPEKIISRFTPTKKVGRNESCPCGSGKKYKKCCL